MPKNSSNIVTKLLKVGICCFLFVTAIFTPSNSLAIYDGARTVAGFTEGSGCDVGTMDFSPFMNNKDVEWEQTNPICIGFIAGAAAGTFIAESGAAYACSNAKAAAQVAIHSALGIPLSPDTINRQGEEAGTCSALWSYSHAQAALCCAGLAATLATTAIVIGSLAAMWNEANHVFKSARICGHNWSNWEKKSQNDGTIDGGKDVDTKVKGSRQLCLEMLFLGVTNNGGDAKNCGSDSSMTISNKDYREFIYGGVEYEDSGDGGCKNPSSWDSTRRNEILGYTGDNQRYYMTGPGAAPVFACYRFKAAVEDENDRSEMQASYDCCAQRSQETICIEHKSSLLGSSYGSKFCKIGSRCEISGVTFEVYQSRKDYTYACGKTYSLCPYNHLIGGGTELENMDKTDTSLLLNYCQVNKHCSKLPILPYVYNPEVSSGFVSKACKDLKGDSQNEFGFSAELLPINTRGFSAPLVQCFKETMENIFLHKAGYSLCSDPDELPINDVCTGTTGYIFQKGKDLPGKSFFLTVQDKFQKFVKMALVASVIAFGFAILLAVPGMHITRKVLISYVLKIGLVMYFAVGDGWQFGFMEGLLGTSSLLAEMTFKVDESGADNLKDGCQFPRFDYNDANVDTKYDNPQYPPNKEYLRIWDTLDCKIARALGFGPEVSVPNLGMAVAAGFFTGGLGIVFVVGAFTFAFFLISMTIKAVHTFLMSMTSVIILLYVSPLIITLSLFERTKKIFEQWWRQLLGFTLQPMILFAYLGILVTLLDGFIIGSATFTPSTYTDSSGASVTDSYGRHSPKKISCAGDAEDDSLYCIFRLNDIDTYAGLEIIGIGIPILTSMNRDKMETILKAALVMFIFSSFSDKVMGLASKLVGGASLQSDWGSSTSKLLGKAYGGARAVQMRAVQGISKHAPKLAKKVANVPRKAVSNLTNKGKGVDKSDNI